MSLSPGLVYMIPSLLSEEAIETIPGYILNAVKECKVLFVENERTSRRFLKKLEKEIVIDSFEWHTIDKQLKSTRDIFLQKLKEALTIGIISEAGCPGIADPGQDLVLLAHQHNAIVKPLVGPSSILLALMGSGLNGQQFQFLGYLPIEEDQRIKSIREMENESKRKKCTQIFIETPYRNNQLLASILKTCTPTTLLCIAVNLTGKEEKIETKQTLEWKKSLPDLHKKPVIFCLLA